MVVKVTLRLLLMLLWRYDFFLVSQSVRQGTVAPTHYNVIHDTTQLKPDHMQRLAYKLCHLYYNWPVRLYWTLYLCCHQPVAAERIVHVCLCSWSYSNSECELWCTTRANFTKFTNQMYLGTKLHWLDFEIKRSKVKVITTLDMDISCSVIDISSEEVLVDGLSWRY